MRLAAMRLAKSVQPAQRFFFDTKKVNPLSEKLTNPDLAQLLKDNPSLRTVNTIVHALQHFFFENL